MYVYVCMDGCWFRFHYTTSCSKSSEVVWRMGIQGRSTTPSHTASGAPSIVVQASAEVLPPSLCLGVQTLLVCNRVLRETHDLGKHTDVKLVVRESEIRARTPHITPAHTVDGSTEREHTPWSLPLKTKTYPVTRSCAALRIASMSTSPENTDAMAPAYL